MHYFTFFHIEKASAILSIVVHYYEVVVRPVLEYAYISSLALTKQQIKTVKTSSDVPSRLLPGTFHTLTLASQWEFLPWLTDVPICVGDFLHVSLTTISTLFIIYYLLSVTLS